MGYVMHVCHVHSKEFQPSLLLVLHSIKCLTADQLSVLPPCIAVLEVF